MEGASLYCARLTILGASWIAGDEGRKPPRGHEDHAAHTSCMISNIFKSMSMPLGVAQQLFLPVGVLVVDGASNRDLGDPSLFYRPAIEQHGAVNLPICPDASVGSGAETTSVSLFLGVRFHAEKSSSPLKPRTRGDGVRNEGIFGSFWKKLFGMRR